MSYLPQALATYSVANAGTNDLTFPYMPAWGNYVPVHISVLMMARQAGNTACTPALRDAALAFSAPMDGVGGYYSAFDMATTAERARAQ